MVKKIAAFFFPGVFAILEDIMLENFVVIRNEIDEDEKARRDVEGFNPELV